MDVIHIYTDGSCLSNPGDGGCACVFNLNGNIMQFSMGFENTTNNRMELMGVICALHEMYKMIVKFKKIESVGEIKIYSDSSYVVNAINQKWVQKWRDNEWISSNNKSVKNVDLWVEILGYIKKVKNEGKVKKITFVKVKGHNGVMLNEKADELARGKALEIKNSRKRLN